MDGEQFCCSRKSYLLVTEDDFSKAAQLTSKMAQQGARKVSQRANENPPNTEGKIVSPVFSGSLQMEDNGLEPMTYALPARRSPN